MGLKEAFQEHWVAASKIGSLEELEFINHVESLHASVSPGPKFKGRLRRLALVGIEMEAISAPLGSINADPLVNLKLSIAYPSHAEPSYPNGKLAPLQAFKNLERLHVEVDGSGDEGQLMSWQDVIPILSCRKLKELMIMVDEAVDTKARLQAMVLAWPRIQRGPTAPYSIVNTLGSGWPSW